MAELSLKDIENKLNDQFDSGERLIFWYDAESSFEESLEQMVLHDAKICRLDSENAFRMKLLLEHDDPKGKYLVYAPFEKPDAEHNHLEDTLLYSTEFYADRMSLIASEIQVPDHLRESLRKIAAFFGVGVQQKTKKERQETEKHSSEFVERAKEINLRAETEDVMPVLAMCVLAKARNSTVDDLIYSVLSHKGLDEDEVISEFAKYGLADDFWRICSIRYGFTDDEPNLIKLVRALFATYIGRDLQEETPDAWNNIILPERTNVNVLLDNMMNSVLYGPVFDNLSEKVADLLEVNGVLELISIDRLINSSATRGVDDKIISWIIDRILDENRLAQAGGKSIEEICEIRRKLHFGNQYQWQYVALRAAYEILSALDYSPRSTLYELTDSYVKKDYQIDQAYRRFLYAYDQVENADKMDQLKERILNIYQNEYLEKIVYAWNSAFAEEENQKVLPLQKDFYETCVKSVKEKVAVIISDAFRYEAAQELVEKLETDQNCEVKFDAMLGSLPSYTQVGMAQLLPHDTIQMTEAYEVLADGESTTGTLAREKILQKDNTNAAAIQYEDIRGKKAGELKEYSAGKEVIYIYHNKIDAKGEAQTTEHYVFDACQEAIEDIYKLIKFLSKSGNVYRFIVTTDHGFIYNRKQNTESDKLSHAASKDAFKDRRFIIDKEDLSTDGVYSIGLGDALGCSDERYLMLAKGMSVFKTGGGTNYVHGGSSPQELILPNIFVKTKKGIVDTEDAELILVTNLNKVTNLLMPLDFMQEYPVSDTVKKASYKISFVSSDGELISNEIPYEADSTSDDPRDRMFRLKFEIKKKSYDMDKQYYLKIVNAKTGKEILSKQVIIDLPFTDNFGF